jgi:hypothetical protein
MNPQTDVVNIATVVSEQVCEVFPSYVRAFRILEDGRTIEVSEQHQHQHQQHVGNSINNFFPDDCDMSDEKKRLFFWQYHRAMECQEFTAILAMIFKDLSDNSVTLAHNGRAVVDILVLNTTEFNVLDLLDPDETCHNDPILRIHDPITGVTVPIIATYDTMDRLSDLGESACAQLGIQYPHKEDREKLKSI